MSTHRLILGDAIKTGLPDKSVNLVFGSSPYECQRTYSMGFNLKGQAFVDWMVAGFREWLRVCDGLVCMVLEGFTSDFRWSASPALLMADLHRAGICLRKPPAFFRVGIPGSGGPDWLRNDFEFMICATNGGKLPWSNNTAMGHPPKWGPGGEMSNRLSDGSRRNQWGGLSSTGARRPNGERRNGNSPSHVVSSNRDVMGFTNGGGRGRYSNGLKKKTKIIEHTKANGETVMREARQVITRERDGSHDQSQVGYSIPSKANPGNIIQERYTAEQVATMLTEYGDVSKHIVGGGVMGHKLAHENEAPFPTTLANFIIRSFCPPGGTVLDPFCGSGSTGHAALEAGRNFIGIDKRFSQIKIATRRLREVSTALQAKGAV